MTSPTDAFEPSPPAAAPRFTLGALVVIGAVLRVLYAGRSGLWRDEALFLSVAGAPSVGALLEFLRFHESHPPLFYLMMRGWQSLFGPSEAVALALPVLLGVALIPVTYCVGARVFSRRGALLAAGLVAASPILAEHAALARPYSLVPLLALLTAYALWRALKDGSHKAWVAYAVLLALNALTHNFGWVLAAAFGLSAASWLVFRAGRGFGKDLAALIAAHLGMGVLCAPWLGALAFQVQHAGHEPKPAPGLLFPLTTFAKSMTSLPSQWAAIAALAAILALAFYSRSRRRAPDTTRDPAFWLFLAVPLFTFMTATIGSAHSDMLMPRTLLTVAPCFLLAGSEALARVVPLRSRGAFGVLGAGLVAGYLAMAIAMLALPKSNAREVAQAVTQHVEPTDLVLVTPEWMASSFNYYFHAPNRQIDFPVDGRELATPFNDLAARIADPQALRRVKAELAAQRARNQRVWLITDRSSLLAGAPAGEGLPPEVPPSHWNMIGSLRTSQLADELQRLYGRPRTQVVNANGPDGTENLTAVLYAPPSGPTR